MFKRIASFCLLVVLALTSQTALAKSKKHHKKKGHKSYKVSKHKRKSRRYKHGSGPDLKSITTESPYTEGTSNGVNPVETKQPSN